jgi:hypothetical protein
LVKQTNNTSNECGIPGTISKQLGRPIAMEPKQQARPTQETLSNDKAKWPKLILPFQPKSGASHQHLR